MHPSFDSKIRLLNIYPGKMKTCVHTKTGMQMIIVAFVTSPNWKQARCLSYGERIKLWCIYTMAYVYTTEYCSALNGGTVGTHKSMNGSQVHYATWKKKSQMLKGCHLRCDSIYVTFSLTKSYRNRKQMTGCLGLECKGTWGENLGWWKCSMSCECSYWRCTFTKFADTIHLEVNFTVCNL